MWGNVPTGTTKYTKMFTQLTFVIDVGGNVHSAGVGVEVEVGSAKLPHLVSGEVVDGALDLGLVLALNVVGLEVAVDHHLLGVEILHLLRNMYNNVSPILTS